MTDWLFDIKENQKIESKPLTSQIKNAWILRTSDESDPFTSVEQATGAVCQCRAIHVLAARHGRIAFRPHEFVQPFEVCRYFPVPHLFGKWRVEPYDEGKNGMAYRGANHHVREAYPHVPAF
jgi:hypothetical protein